MGNNNTTVSQLTVHGIIAMFIVAGLATWLSEPFGAFQANLPVPLDQALIVLITGAISYFREQGTL